MFPLGRRRREAPRIARAGSDDSSDCNIIDNNDNRCYCDCYYYVHAYVY